MIARTLHNAAPLLLRASRLTGPGGLCLALVLGGTLLATAVEAQTPLQTVEVESDADHTRVRVRGSEAATFSVYTLRSPFRVFLDVAESDGSALPRRLDVDNGTLRTVQVSNEADALSQTTRIVLQLEEETYFDVRNEGNDILIELQNRAGTTTVSVTSAPTPPVASASEDAALDARLRELEAQLAAADAARREALQRASAATGLDARASQMEAELLARDARIQALERDLAASAATQDSAARAQALLETRERELALAQARLDEAEARDEDAVEAAGARIRALEAQVAEMESARLEQERAAEAARVAAAREREAALEAERARSAARADAAPPVIAAAGPSAEETRRAQQALADERASLDRERLVLAREDASRTGRSSARETAAQARLIVAAHALANPSAPTPPPTPVIVRVPPPSGSAPSQAPPALPIVSVSPGSTTPPGATTGRTAPRAEPTTPQEETRGTTNRRTSERCRVVTTDALSGQRTTRTIPCPR